MIRLFLFAPGPNYKLMRSPCQSVGRRTESEKLTNAFAVELGEQMEKREARDFSGDFLTARERESLLVRAAADVPSFCDCQRDGVACCFINVT